MRWAMGIIGALAVGVAAPAVAAEPWSTAAMMGVRLEVKDFTKSIAFYTALGMTEGQRYHPYDQELHWADASQGPKIFLLHDEPGDAKLTPGTASLLFQSADIAATAKKLRDAGVPDVDAPKANKAYTFIMLKDPDGNRIEVMGAPPK